MTTPARARASGAVPSDAAGGDPGRLPEPRQALLCGLPRGLPAWQAIGGHGQIATHAEGVIALTGCLQSRFCQHLLEGRARRSPRPRRRADRGVRSRQRLLRGPEERPHRSGQANEGIVRIARELGRPLVGTGDVHYLRREDYHHHAALLCVQTKSTLSQPKISFETNEFYLRSGDEMAQAFAQWPEAIATTLEIAERCDVELELDRQLIPRYPTPDGISEAEYLRERVQEGLRRRYGDPPPAAALERADYELGVIERMGFSGYFLIVWDFVKYAKDSGIAVGPGRGSAAGSLVAYSLADHRRRSVALRPAVRAIPQPRARVDARHRHRLLRPRPRAGDPLRHGQVRQGVGRPDRDLRQDVPARGDPRRCQGPWARLRGRRSAREVDPGSDDGSAPELRGVPQAGAAASG